MEYCPIGAVALYLFYRYHIHQEPWPPFQDREIWYETKLIAKRNNPYEILEYQSHLEMCNRAFREAKCIFLKGTHVGRREGCRMADLLDVPDAQMRRLGRWDHSRMTQHYSTGLARAGARMLGGHTPDAGNSLILITL